MLARLGPTTAASQLICVSVTEFVRLRQTRDIKDQNMMSDL
jgi:hypothetical protein